MPVLLAHRWIYKQAELVLLDVAASLEEPAC